MKISKLNFVPGCKTTNWVEGLRFVQLKKNRCLNSGISRSPYAAMFGSHMRVGLSDSILPADVLKGIETEEDFEEKLAAFNNNVGSHEMKSDSEDSYMSAVCSK